MLKPALLFTCLALAGSSHAADDKALWKAAFQLAEPDQAKKAATTLRSDPAAGYDVLSKLSRAVGDRLALGFAARELGCHMRMAMPFMGHTERGMELPQSAAKLATELLLENRALREQLLGSEEPFDRAMALIVSAGVPDALPAALKRLENEKEPRVLEMVQGASSCARMRTGAEVDEEANRLSRKLDTTVQQPRCEQESATMDKLVDGVIKGSYQVAGWSRSGDTFTVTMKRGADNKSDLAPPCALALYDALAKRGTYVPGLVLPITEQNLLPLSTRDAAARRAIKHLERYPESGRNKQAAELVNAGYEVPVKVTWRAEDSFGQENELEAAARQGDKKALAAIERFVFCRGTFGSHGLAMLGYLKTPDAADTAYQLAQQCPNALGAGTAALLRLKDPRALHLLGKAMENSSFAEDDMQRAAVESYTPALGRELRRMAESNDGYRAKEMLRILKLAGVMRD